MKSILQSLGGVGFHQAENYQQAISVDENISSEAIVTRFRQLREVPSEILLAIENIKEKDQQKEAAVHLLRISIHARTLAGQSGGILAWFERGKIKDAGSDTKISVFKIKKCAEAFNKTTGQFEDAQKRVRELTEASTLSKRQQASLDKSAAKAEAYGSSVNSEQEEFVRVLEQVYMSLASERR